MFSVFYANNRDGGAGGGGGGWKGGGGFCPPTFEPWQMTSTNELTLA